MSIPDDSEEKPLTFSELQALAEKLDRQPKPASEPLPEVSEEELLALGGKKVEREFFDRRRQALRQTEDIIFGPEGETQLVFRRVEGTARWTVSMPPVPVSGYDRDRELTKSNRGLWVAQSVQPLPVRARGSAKEKGEPHIALKAVEQLLACYTEIKRQSRRALLLLLLRRPREGAKQQATSSIEPETTKDALYIYPKPLLETLLEERHALALANEQLAAVSEQLETVNEQRLRAQHATVLVVEVLSKDLQARDAKARADGKVHRPQGKLQIAFDLWRSDQWPEDIQTLLDWARILAKELQRPPTKLELRKRCDPDEGMDPAQFSRLLNPAGLSWLPGA